MNKFFYLIVLFSLFSSCKKEVVLTDETNFDIEINRDEFSDTIYWINNLNVVSTNDDVLEYGLFSLTDEDGNILYSGDWKNARNTSFGLTDRRQYSLNATLSQNNENLTQVDLEIDNIDYPDRIKINSLSINNSVLSNDGTYYVSNSYGTLLTIYFSPDALFESDNYNVDLATVFYQKLYSPQSTTINLNNFSLPTRSINREWRQYEINVGYPLVVGSSGTTVVDDRKVYFYMNLEDLAKNGISSANITLYYVSDDSDQGGIYSGTLEYEWIYEN